MEAAGVGDSHVRAVNLWFVRFPACFDFAGGELLAISALDVAEGDTAKEIRSLVPLRGGYVCGAQRQTDRLALSDGGVCFQCINRAVSCSNPMSIGLAGDVRKTEAIRYADGPWM